MSIYRALESSAAINSKSDRTRAAHSEQLVRRDGQLPNTFASRMEDSVGDCRRYADHREEISEQAHRKPVSTEAIRTSDLGISRNSPVFVTLVIRSQHKE